MNNKNLQNRAAETEILTADEKKIAEIIGGLDRVSAPNDFEFRLKARIAQNQKGSSQTGNWQWVRYVLPVGASAFVLAFVLYATNFFAPSAPPNTEVAEKTEVPRNERIVNPPIEKPANTLVAVSTPEITQEVKEIPANIPIETETPSKIEKTIEVASKSPTLQKRSLPNRKPDEGGGSSVSAVRTAPIIIAPEFNANSPDFLQMLNINGIETVSESGKRKIKSIQENSTADKAGVKVGDVIQSFDEKKGNANANSVNVGSRRILTVTRDGKRMEFDLKNDQ